MSITTETIYRLTQPHIGGGDYTELVEALDAADAMIAADLDNTPVYMETVVKISAA